MVSKSGVRYTTIINKYPSYRDDSIKGCWKWLEGRRKDDNAEGLWRVHDKIYDLKEFIGKHPGGKEWLILSKGTDITEAFESYHILPKASQVLQKYYVKEADATRNYRITYEENGFYRTLKRKVAEKLPTLDKSDLWKSKLFLDIIVIGFFMGSIMAVRSNLVLTKIFFIFIAGLCGGCINSTAHNFSHQRNNWRMRAANFVLTGWRDWRVFHGMSHHLYPNSYTDFEITAFEPFLRWIPVQNRKRFEILFSYAASPFVYISLFHATYFYRLSGSVFSKTRVLYYDEMLTLLPPLMMFLFGNSMNLVLIFFTWTVIILVSSLLYAITSINAGHHGCEIVHEGDEFKSLDFGIYQLAATVDRIETNANLIMSLTNFGDHTLHHMFPSLDHALLPQLRGILAETCREFDVEFRKYTCLNALIDQFKQLSRTTVITFDKTNNNDCQNSLNLNGKNGNITSK